MPMFTPNDPQRGSGPMYTPNDPQMRGTGNTPGQYVPGQGVGYGYGQQPTFSPGDPKMSHPGAMPPPGPAYQAGGYNRDLGISPQAYARMTGTMGRFGGHVPTGQHANDIYAHFGVDPSHYAALQTLFRSILPHLFGNRGF